MLNLQDTIKIEVKRSRGKQNETYYGVVCPTCGEKRYLRKSDAQRAIDGAKPCKSCTARKGYEATIAKYGEDFFLDLITKQQLAQPSKEELIIESTLEAKGVEFARQWRFKGAVRRYLIDFVILQNGVVKGAIEFNGVYWHSTPQRMQRDADLAAEIPYPLLVLENTADLDRKIQTFLKEL